MKSADSRGGAGSHSRRIEARAAQRQCALAQFRCAEKHARRRRPSVFTVNKIAKRLNTTVSDLLGETTLDDALPHPPEYRFPIRPERFIGREYDYPQALHAWVVPKRRCRGVEIGLAHQQAASVEVATLPPRQALGDDEVHAARRAFESNADIDVAAIEAARPG